MFAWYENERSTLTRFRAASLLMGLGNERGIGR